MKIEAMAGYPQEFKGGAVVHDPSIMRLQHQISSLTEKIKVYIIRNVGIFLSDWTQVRLMAHILAYFTILIGGWTLLCREPCVLMLWWV